MFDKRQKLETATADVYILCRVFNLTSGRIGLRLYVEPKIAEEEGKLIFAPYKWAVKAAEEDQ